MYAIDFFKSLFSLLMFVPLAPFAAFIWAAANWNKRRDLAVTLLIVHTLAVSVWIFILIMETTH